MEKFLTEKFKFDRYKLFPCRHIPEKVWLAGAGKVQKKMDTSLFCRVKRDKKGE